MHPAQYTSSYHWRGEVTFALEFKVTTMLTFVYVLKIHACMASQNSSIVSSYLATVL